MSTNNAASSDTFKDQKKLRQAEIITPPNFLKQKVGSGGLEEAVLVKAQSALENNTVDFKPIAAELLTTLKGRIENVKNGDLQGESAIEAMISPAMQLKAQGAMFRFPLVTDISDILVNFLETIESPDANALEIVSAHKVSLSAVINGNMTGNGGPQGEALKTSLNDACARYYKAKKV